MLLPHKIYWYLFFQVLLCCRIFSQADSTIYLRFDFNDQRFREANDKIVIKPIGVTLADDRFGNKNKAAYFHGNASSYLNLGTSRLVKPVKGTIAMWVNMQSIVLAGKGYSGTPFFIIKNLLQGDFDIGCGIGYNREARRLGAQVSQDSLREVTVFAKDTLRQGEWYHIAIVYDDHYFAFYMNGEMQGKFIKNFRSAFSEEDSVVFGRTIGIKNERYVNAIFDDICFYHRTLSEQEVKDLYNEPNPNHLANIIREVFKYGIVIILLCIIIVLILIRNRYVLKKQKEKYELSYLQNRIKEMEIKVVKTQMNPHFISNCLTAIQNLIYSSQIAEAGEYLYKFNILLRQVLDSFDKHYLRLDEEIEIIKLNVALEQLRFTDDFIFELKIEEGIALRDIQIPALITQPFVENAIWHGLLPLKGKEARLTVSIYKKENIVYLAIEDNGIGRSNSQAVEGKNSKGTRLVIDKIESLNQLRNSADFDFEIIDLFDEAHRPAGTKVIIQLDISDE